MQKVSHSYVYEPLTASFTSRVSGSAVRFRHYPVTVCAERRAGSFNATGAKALGRQHDLEDAQVRRPARL